MGAAQLPLGLRLRDASVFASFFGGRNQAVVDVLRSVASATPAATHAPTCIWVHGASGTGKTHLLQALCADARLLRTAYLPLREATGCDDEMLSGYGQFELVCLDDAEAIAGQPAWEQALFRLHQELDEQGGRLVVAGAALPSKLDFRLRDLASRLNGGLVLTLHALDESEQIEALQLRAQLRGFELPEDTARFLLRRIPRTMAKLCSFLDELDAASLIAQRRLTIPFVKQVMESRAT